MITDEIVKEIADKAQARFPIPQETLLVLQFTGDRSLIEPVVKARVKWMLEQAFEMGTNNANNK